MYTRQNSRTGEESDHVYYIDALAEIFPELKGKSEEEKRHLEVMRFADFASSPNWGPNVYRAVLGDAELLV